MLDAIDQYFADGDDPGSNEDEEIVETSKHKPNSPSKEPWEYNVSDDESFIDEELLKLENDSFDEHEPESDSSDSDSSFPSFGAKLKPKFVEFTNIFPPYPKTHPEGFAHVIELPPEILADEKKVNKFRTALQYSMTKGHGIKTRHNVPFFSIDGEDVPMNYFYRQCNGTRTSIFKW
jgi:hypothetical protein